MFFSDTIPTLKKLTHITRVESTARFLSFFFSNCYFELGSIACLGQQESLFHGYNRKNDVMIDWPGLLGASSNLLSNVGVFLTF